MKFRSRDAFAALLSAILIKLVFQSSNPSLSSESLTVSTVLAFYSDYRATVTIDQPRPVGRGAGAEDDDIDGFFDDDYDDDDDAAPPPRRRRVNPTDPIPQEGGVIQRRISTATPIPFDVDGDGTVEALAVPTIIRNDTESGTRTSRKGPAWGLHLLDLKPLHGRRGAAAELTALPFYPEIMFRSDPVEIDESWSNNENGGGKRETQQLQPPVPLRMTSGQILLRGYAAPTSSSGGSTNTGGASGMHKPPGKFVASEDKTRHYFCGNSWHDASERCHQPCQDGQSTSCPEGETCYADTPCDSEHRNDGGSGEGGDVVTELILTPKNGLPSVATVWSDGSITMHSLTGDYVVGEGKKETTSKKKKKTSDKGKGTDGNTDSLLELRTMWRINPFQPQPSAPTSSSDGQEQQEQLPPLDLLEFDEIDLTLDTTAPVGTNGAVVVAAHYLRKSADGRFRPATSYHALDAMSGTIIWSHGDPEGRGLVDPARMVNMGDAAAIVADAEAASKLEEAAVEGTVKMPPAPAGSTSSARRRSFLPGTTSAAATMASLISDDDVTASEDCMGHYRRWVLDPDTGVLPHVSWGSGRDDAAIRIAHFDRKHQGRKGGDRGKKGGKNGLGWQQSILSSVSRRTKTDKSGKKGALESVRPNMVLFRNREGVSVLSLRNGKSVCHLSLLSNSLYADINFDGQIEQVQVITSPMAGRAYDSRGSSAMVKAGKEASQTFVSDLVNRAIKNQAKGGGRGGAASSSPLCHILVLSGIPARREVFSANLCSDQPTTPGKGRSSAAPPLAVPSLSQPGMDMVFALNSRQVSRYDPTGKELWTTSSDHNPIPSWHATANSSPANLSPIDFAAVTRGVASPAIRPILVTGQDGAAILSGGRGNMLSSFSFPQGVISRPILADISGDGTSDIIAVSSDAIWAYKVTVRASSASFLRIVVGLLMMSIALAALYNRFSQPPGSDRRSTDA